MIKASSSRSLGTFGADNIEAGAGNDIVCGRGRGGNDIIKGQDGADELHGEGNNDFLDGGNGNDTLQDHG